MKEYQQMNKLEKLRALRESFTNLKIEGTENFPLDKPAIVMANHNCLMDMLYLPMSIPTKSVCLISSRTLFKNNPQRQTIINEYLHTMPVEVHAGKDYSKMCLNFASKMISNGFGVNIFPEGAYLDDNTIYKGRTGISRILFNVVKNNRPVYFIPIAISVKNNNGDLDAFSTIDNNEVEVKILEPINYQEAFSIYTHSDNEEDRRHALHIPVDQGMREIAKAIGKEYVDEYIELIPRKNIFLPDGTSVDIKDVSDGKYKRAYHNELKARSKMLIKELKSTNN